MRLIGFRTALRILIVNSNDFFLNSYFAQLHSLVSKLLSFGNLTKLILLVWNYTSPLPLY